MTDDEELEAAIDELTEALRLTVEYVGNEVLPAREGWTWFDVLKKYRPAVAEEFIKDPATPQWRGITGE